MLSLIGRRAIARTGRRAFATSAFPPPKLFDYETVTKNLTVGDAIESVEQAFKGECPRLRESVPVSFLRTALFLVH